MIQHSKEQFFDAIQYIKNKYLANFLYTIPVYVFVSMPLVGMVLILFEFDKTILGWFLSISSFLIFLSLLIHSQWVVKKANSIFLIAFLNGYLLEYVLVNILQKYSYNNLPFSIFNIPLLIPLGWTSAFYSTSFTSILLLEKFKLEKTSSRQYLIVFTLGVIYGYFLEKLASKEELWNFHFSSISLFSVPLLATLAWGFTLANFDFGITIIQKEKLHILLASIFIFVLNLTVAWILMYFL